MAGARRIDEIIQQNADRLAVALENHMRTSFMPDARKELRPFTSAEAAEVLGMDPARLRKLHFDGKIPEVEMDGRGRRLYSGANIVEMRRVLDAQSRKHGQFLPGRARATGFRLLLLPTTKVALPRPPQPSILHNVLHFAAIGSLRLISTLRAV